MTNWRGATPYLALVVGIAIAYWRPISALATGGWMHSNSLSHGYLLLALSMVEAGRRLKIADWSSRSTEQWPLLLLASLAMSWLVADRFEIETLTQAIVPLVFASATIAFAGWSQRSLSVPWLLMIFAVPGWSWLGPILQAMAIMAVGLLTRLVGIPAFIDGRFIQLPYGILEVADGCAGVHQFTIGVLLSVLLCVFGRIVGRRAVIVVALGIATSLLANWIRIFILVFVGYETQMQHRWVTVDHYQMGWVTFVIVFGMYMLFVSRYATSAVEAVAKPTEVPVVDAERHPVLRAAMVGFAAASGPLASSLLLHP